MDKMTHLKFNLNNFLMALSLPLDNTIQPNINGVKYESRRVSYIALRVSILAQLDASYKSDVFSYALLIKNKTTKENVTKFPFNNTDINSNEIVQNIIQLSLKIEEMIEISSNVIINKQEIINTILKDSTILVSIKELFNELSNETTFWLNLTSPYQLPFLIFNLLEDFTMELDYGTLIEISEVMSEVVANYSGIKYDQNIVLLLDKMCKLYNMDQKDRSRMLVSFHFYDIGKLVIDKELFLKKENLQEFEKEIFQSIPYFTSTIITQMFGFDDIAQLSSRCFEKIDGTGYPYKLQANQISLKNMILSIVVIYKALQENKTYRKKYDKDTTKKILDKYALNKKIESSVLDDFMSLIE